MESSFNMVLTRIIFTSVVCFQFIPLVLSSSNSPYSSSVLNKAQSELFRRPKTTVLDEFRDNESPLKIPSNVSGDLKRSRGTRELPNVTKKSKENIRTFQDNSKSTQLPKNIQTNTHQANVQPSTNEKYDNVPSLLLNERLNSPSFNSKSKALDGSVFTLVGAGADNLNVRSATGGRGQIVLRNDSGSSNAGFPDASSHAELPSAIAANFVCVEKIYLWTNAYKRGQEYELLSDKESVKRSHLVPAAKTYVIFHGLASDGLQPWIMQVKDKLLDREICNVISVQWWAGNSYVDYYRATAYVECTANETVSVLAIASELKQLRPGNLHLIGHSLGAHVAGFVGKKWAGISRISGLDPAGLTYYDTDKSVRLDKTDAEYVDVLHTNGCHSTWDPWGGCYGISNSIGDTDFWPNGGKYQPACQNLQGTAGSEHALAGSIGCDHQMSYKYFIESIDYSTTSRRFLSRYAHSYEDYTNGNASCGASIQYMGFFADHQSKGNHYLNTASISPYAYMDTECPSRIGLMLSWSSILSAYSVLGVTFLAVVLPAIVIVMPVLLAAAAKCGSRVVASHQNLLGRNQEDQVPIVRDDIIESDDEGRDYHSQAESSDYQSQPESF